MEIIYGFTAVSVGFFLYFPVNLQDIRMHDQFFMTVILQFTVK